MHERFFLGKKATGGAVGGDYGEGLTSYPDDDEEEIRLPKYVDDAMADIAVIFTGWTPDSMDKMSIEELMEWRERARVRSEVGKR